MVTRAQRAALPAAGPVTLPVLGAGVPLVVPAPLGFGAGVPRSIVLGFVVVGFGVLGFVVVGFGVLGFVVVGFVVVGFVVVGFVVVGFGVVGFVVVSFLAFTELVLPEEVPLGDAVPAIGLCRTGDRTECADEDAPDRSLVAEAEDGCAGADGAGVGPVHGLEITNKLWVAGLPEPVPEAGSVAVGFGWAEPVGAHFFGLVVGVMRGAVVGVTEGTGATVPGVVWFALGTVLVGFQARRRRRRTGRVLSRSPRASGDACTARDRLARAAAAAAGAARPAACSAARAAAGSAARTAAGPAAGTAAGSAACAGAAG